LLYKGLLIKKIKITLTVKNNLFSDFPINISQYSPIAQTHTRIIPSSPSYNGMPGNVERYLRTRGRGKDDENEFDCTWDKEEIAASLGGSGKGNRHFPN
jgi:hypothetical protein